MDFITLNTTYKSNDSSSLSKNSKKKSSDKERADWTEPRTKSFIDLCVDARLEEGHSVDTNTGFKGAVWLGIGADFNRTNNLNYNQLMLSSKLSDLKAKFKFFENIRDLSGFGWDEEAQIPTAPDQVWDKFIAEHPKAQPYRTRTLPYYAECQSLFGGKYATGKYSSSSTTTTATATTSNPVVKSPISTLLPSVQSPGIAPVDEADKENQGQAMTTPTLKRPASLEPEKPSREKKGKIEKVIQVLNDIRADAILARSALTATQKAAAALDLILASAAYEGTVNIKQKLSMKRAFLASAEAELFLGLSQEEIAEWIQAAMV